jgi:hypothetical protein
LEQRVAALEQQMAQVKAALSNGARQKNWERTVGMFSRDETAKRVDAAILKAREEERRKARRPVSNHNAKEKQRPEVS